MSKLLVLTQ